MNTSKRNKENVSKYDYVYQRKENINYNIKWEQ